MKHFAHLQDLAARVGQPLADSDWLAVEQQRIDAFAGDITAQKDLLSVHKIASAYGVKGIKLEEGDEVVGMVVVNGQEDPSSLLTVCAKGYGKRTAPSCATRSRASASPSRSSTSWPGPGRGA